MGGLSLLSRAEIVASGPPAGVENKQGCWEPFLLQQGHHSVEPPCALGRGKPAAAPAVTLGEDRRIPSCCCGMLGSRICFFFFFFRAREKRGGGGVGGGWCSNGGGAVREGGGRLWRLEGEETTGAGSAPPGRLCERCRAAGNTPEWRKEELPRRFTHTRELTHTDTRTCTLRLILPSCGGIDYGVFPLNIDSVECEFELGCVHVTVQ